MTTDAVAVDFWDVLEQIGYEPHAAQIDVHNSTARNRVVAGGRRTGKSQIGGHELVPEALVTMGMADWLRDNDKRREFWIVGPEYSDSEKEFRVVWNRLKRFGIPFDRPGSYNDPVHGNLHLSCFGGLFQVHGKSAKHPETLVGEGLSGVILAEAAKLKEYVWTKFIRPTLADFQGWALFSSTPEGKNWFYEQWQAGQDPYRPDWDSWRIPSWYNPHVYREPTSDKDVARALEIMAKPRLEIADRLELRKLKIDPEIMSMLFDLTPEMFKQEVAADFTEFVGRVFKEFDEEQHVRTLEFNPRWETYAAVDYGFTNPTVWLLLQVGPFGQIHVLREYYQRGRTTAEAASDIISNGLCPPGLIRFYPDPASPGDSKELSDILRVPYATGGTGGELSERILKIRNALKVPEGLRHLDYDHPDRIPRLLFDRSCVATIRDFLEYRYPRSVEESKAASTNLPEAPMKKDDHAPEALGRFFAGHYGNRNVTKRRSTRVSQARIGR